MTNLKGSNLNRREAAGPKGEGRDSPSTFPEYPEYKDSGVEWLGQVPAHWEMKKLKHLVTCLDGQRVPLNGEQRHSRQGDVPYWGANAIMDYVDEPLFDEDLVLLGEDGAPFFDTGRPVAFKSSGPVWPNNHIHVLRPKNAHWSQHIVNCLNSTNYVDYVEGSTRDKLTQSRMMGIPLTWPPLEERRAITAFLDHETAHIDALVEEQQRLIALLKEKRQAVISHAVTKGLDPDVPMKDSGVEWFGRIPHHWAITKIARLFHIKAGGDLKAELFSVEKCGDFQFPIYTNATDSSYVYGYTSSPSFPAGSLTVTGRGDVGFAIFRDEEFEAIIRLLVLVPEKGVSSKYYTYLINSLLTFSEGKSAIAQLSADQMSPYQVVVPPFREQKDIADFCERESLKLDALTDQAKNLIKLLQERRSALISAAVTGKIDVRGWAPPADSAPADQEARMEAV